DSPPAARRRGGGDRLARRAAGEPGDRARGRAGIRPGTGARLLLPGGDRVVLATAPRHGRARAIARAGRGRAARPAGMAVVGAARGPSEPL
ncbi:MAG: hypothetical protein AVDCRST_MAG57-3375, partial [uncultured Blastococcus sp.]